MSDPILKCNVRDGKFVEPCDTLKNSCEYGHPTGKQKGIFAWAYTNFHGPSRTMFGVKSGNNNSGILFNYCPFCGEKIDAPFVEAK